MENVFVLANPASANGTTAQVWPHIAACLAEKGIKFDHHLTTAPFQAPEIVREALAKGYSTIVAIGGDGTANEVVNGFFKDETPINPRARLAVISRGTGCDFIRTLGIPKDYRQAVDVIARNRERTIDLGLVEYRDKDGNPGQRWFINIADAGLGGMVANRVNHTSKSAGGFLSFLYGTLWSILLYKCGHGRIEADGKLIYQGQITMAAVANGQYFGGGMHLSPPSQIDDGKLELVLIRGMNKISLLFNLARIYRGTHLNHPKITIHPATAVRVTGDSPLPIELDGEAPGFTPVQFVVKPGALRVLY